MTTVPYRFNYEKMVQDLMLTCPWLVSILMRVPGVKIDDTPLADECPWMMTDGFVSYYHEERMSKETMQFGALGIIHEDVHVLLGHALMNREEMINLVDMEVWDYACENVCNYWVKIFGIKVDPRVVYDEKWDGLTEWQIYNEIMKDKPEKDKVKQQMQKAGAGSGKPQNGQGQNPGDGQGGPGKGLPQHQKWGKATPEQAAQAKHESAANLSKIAIDMQKAGRGDSASKIQLLVKAILDDTNWEDILYKYLEYHQIKDYSYAKLDRRSAGSGGFIMPSLVDLDHNKGKLKKAKIAFDTSGSTTGRAQQRCLGGLKKIFEDLGGYECSIIYADAEVHKVVALEEWEQHMPEGGGGTRFEPVFEYIEKEWDDDINVLIYFTDGDGSFPNHQPPYDVIWVNFGRGDNYPFGEVIDFKI
jgi:predicted metal-dependent peptidase